MNSIKRLRRSVHNSLRSSIILFDLPRVVEELTYNSLDSGATKVHVSISVRACYVKVEDDGCGITRDGLVILGERYATSKIHLLADTESNSERLGFRGEALASLSDVSLVEIRTKARGRPNAYCKIMKGSKCLFFGIDDQREAVGTTVIVRDLFYNQPVRRKYIHSSPKRVLHSAKKCILRIALVHPQVSFKVTDIESEDELLGTIPSSSPLPLVSDGFGNEVSSSLQEIVFSDQILMLSGYISGLTNAFSTKAFQYLYINSRFVCKGPIHNLLNSLAASFQLSLSQLKAEPEFQSGKRHKTQGYPAYLLNLCCPLSSYDLHYEPSKTIVEFKDWNTILSFFEQAIRHFWEQLSAKSLQGKTFAHDADVPIESEIPKEEVFIAGILKSSKTRKSKCDIQLHQNLPSHSPMTSTLDISLEDINVYQKHGISCEEMHRSSVLKPCQNETGYLDQADYSSQHVIHDSHDAFASAHAQMGCANSNTQQWTADVGSCLLENHFFSNQTPKFKDEDDISEIEWKDNPPEGSRSLKKELNQNLLTCGPYDIINNTEEIQFPLACLSAHSSLEIESSPLMQNEQGCSAYYTNHSDFGVGFDHLGNDFSLYDTVDAAEAEYHKESLIWDTLFQEKKDASRPSFNVIRKCQLTRELVISASDPITPFSCEEACLGEENNLHDGLASEIWIAGSKCGSPEIDWHLGSPQLFCASTLRTVHDFTQGCTSRGNLMPFKGSGCRYSGISEEKAEILNSVQNNSNEVFPTGYTKTKLDYPYCFSPERNYGSPSNQITFGEVSSSGKLNDETGWSFVETSNITNTSICGKYAFNFSVQNQDEGAENPWGDQEFQNCQLSNVHKVRSRRSCSAPPFYKGKHKFSILNDHLTTAEGKDSIFQSSYDAKISPETICSFNGLSQPCCVHPYLKPNLNDVFQPFSRECVDEKLSTHEMNGMQNIGGFDDVHYNQSSHTNAAEGSITDELKYALATPTKWRTGIPQPTVKDVSHNYPENQEDILNISSGLLHLSGSSLVPESINKDCLEDARVLLQLDRKFIPVMADGILVIIDQHAADERIRLEELRQKVLSGEGKSITYLESEQELVLPEMGFQLLQKYAEQIQKWGWMCNIHSQCSESFAKNMNLLKRRARGVTLVAVPCILGINLTDKDLIEFIEQLVETDGSSTLPPSVLRILNFKACRGAIMFGDSLLPSECSLIVEELKATSLCFQCAHGRPTTVPLLNMASLHEQLARLEMEKGGPGETWHGLRRHAPRIERAQLRLESAKRFHGG